MAITPTQLSTALTSSSLPLPSPSFLDTLLSTQRTQPPLPALLATAKHRLLATSWTSSPQVLAPSTPSFPPNLFSPHVLSLKLDEKIPVQVLGVEDLGKSRWEQLEAIEAKERGEMTKGREIIRVADIEDGENGDVAGAVGAARNASGSAGASGGLHRLVLQDVKGQSVYGLELRPVNGIGMDMSIGSKLVLNDVTVARGVVLLEPETVVVLGGKIEALHQVWVENRKKDLLAAIEGQAR